MNTFTQDILLNIKVSVFRLSELAGDFFYLQSLVIVLILNKDL